MQKKMVGIFLVILLIIPVLPASRTEEPQPDLICEGALYWYDVKPNTTIYHSFKVENIGDPGSSLDWEIWDYPSWGKWTFNPVSGTDLTPEDGPVQVVITLKVPNVQNQDFKGMVKVINVENYDDNCSLLVGLTGPPPVWIVKPTRAIYYNNEKIIKFIIPVIFGPIDIVVSTGILIDWVEFYIDGKLKHNDTVEPFNWKWDKPKILIHKIIIKAHDRTRKYTIRRIYVWTFF